MQPSEQQQQQRWVREDELVLLPSTSVPSSANPSVRNGQNPSVRNGQQQNPSVRNGSRFPTIALVRSNTSTHGGSHHNPQQQKEASVGRSLHGGMAFNAAAFGSTISPDPMAMVAGGGFERRSDEGSRHQPNGEGSRHRPQQDGPGNESLYGPGAYYGTSSPPPILKTISVPSVEAGAPHESHHHRGAAPGPPSTHDLLLDIGGPDLPAGTAGGAGGPVVVVLDTVQPGPLDERGSGFAAHSARAWLTNFFRKWRGVGDKAPPRDTWPHLFWAWVGSFVSILAIALINQFVSPQIELPLLVASFGASAVLLFGAPDSKLAQPRHFLGGHLLSAIVGVVVRDFFYTAGPNLLPLSAAIGMATALLVMLLTRTTHPPGGATALIASSLPVIGPWYGFKFVITILWASAIMLLVALIINNISTRRRYPTYWLGA